MSSRDHPSSQLMEMPIPDLSPDILYLLEKLPDGDIEGVVYRPSECSAIVRGPTPEAVDQCVTRFQSAYRKVISPGQLKVEEVQHSPSLDHSYVLFLVGKLNCKHNQCVFVYLEEKSSVKVISNAPRQFETAKKELRNVLGRYESPNNRPPLIAVRIGGKRVFTLKQSDLVAEDVEVIVNAANEDLSHGAGLARALDQASGGALQIVSKSFIASNGHKCRQGVWL